MYNEAQKREFLSTYSTRLQPYLEDIFERFGRAEERIGQDISQMSEEEQDVLIKTLFKPTENLKWIRKLISAYSGRGVSPVETTSEYNESQSDSRPRRPHTMTKEQYLQQIRERMVMNPLHLHQLLDAVLAPIDSNHTDILVRCYYWLVYSGVSPRSTLKIKKSDLDFNNMVIHDGDRIREIYSESVPAFRKAITQDYFAVWQDEKEVLLKRPDSPLLLSETDGTANIERFYTKNLKGIFDRSNYPSNYRDILVIKESGIFYRLYTRERARGVRPSVFELAYDNAPSSVVEEFMTDERSGGPIKRRAEERERKYNYWKEA